VESCPPERLQRAPRRAVWWLLLAHVLLELDTLALVE
jgi:hypothetical protein